MDFSKRATGSGALRDTCHDVSRGDEAVAVGIARVVRTAGGLVSGAADQAQIGPVDVAITVDVAYQRRWWRLDGDLDLSGIARFPIRDGQLQAIDPGDVGNEFRVGGIGPDDIGIRQGARGRDRDETPAERERPPRAHLCPLLRGPSR